MGVFVLSFTILFDYDGVIVDSIDLFAEAVTFAGRQLNQPVTFGPEDLRNIKTMSIPEITEVAGVEECLTRDFILGIEKELYRRALEIPVFPGMVEVIQQLRSFGNMAVVSATSERVVSEVLEKHSVLQYMCEIVGGDTEGSKSSKIRSLIDKYEGSAARTCMIGDTVSDIQQSKLAQVISIAVSWGWHRMDWLRTACPDFEVHRPTDLIQLVKQLSES